MSDLLTVILTKSVTESARFVVTERGVHSYCPASMLHFKDYAVDYAHDRASHGETGEESITVEELLRWVMDQRQ